MSLSRAALRAAALLGAAFCIRMAVGQAATAPAASEPATSPGDEIIVRGRALEGLKLRIERAEDDVYTRFNEINSDDSYDIHCYERAPAGTRIKKRMCVSNAARAADIAIAEASVRALQGPLVAGSDGTTATATPGGVTAFAQQQHAKQLDTERRIRDELRRLAYDDPALGAAVGRLGDAYRALDVVAGSRPGETLYTELDGAQALPFDAQHLFEVQVGNVAWSHSLTARTFTLANVHGRIRDLRVDCDKTAANLDYEADAEWSVPDSWGACTLRVGAKRGTTFALYEFD